MTYQRAVKIGESSRELKAVYFLKAIYFLFFLICIRNHHDVLLNINWQSELV